MRKFYHVTKSGEGWVGKLEKTTTPVVTSKTKVEAVAKTIALAKKNQPSSVRIHKADGKIQEERTYPRSTDPKGTRG